MNTLLFGRSVNWKEVLLHLAYWFSFTLFFGLVWGTYDKEYLRNFIIQIYSLPARLILVYGTLGILFPRFLEKDKYLTFALAFLGLLIFAGLAIQRPVMVFWVEGIFLPYQSDHFFKITYLMNTILDVNLAAILPIGYYLFRLWNKSRQEVASIIQKQQSNPSIEKQFLLLKIGNQHHKLYYKDIILLESQRNYLRIKTLQKEFTYYGSISAMMETLPQDKFVRVQRSFIINFDYLESFSSNQISLRGERISIGRKYKKEVLEKFRALQ